MQIEVNRWGFLVDKSRKKSPQNQFCSHRITFFPWIFLFCSLDAHLPLLVIVNVLKLSLLNVRWELITRKVGQLDHIHWQQLTICGKIWSYSLKNIWHWKCCLRQICWWSCVGDKHISRYNTHSHGHWHLGPSMSSLSNPSIPCLPSPTIASLCAVCKGGIIIWVHWAVHTECKIFESTLRFLICRRRLRCEDLVLLYLNSWKAFCVFVL